MSNSLLKPTSTAHPHDHLIELINPWVASLGYQIIHLEVQTHRQKTLRLFIDFLHPSTEKKIGIEDCASVSRALDEKLDQIQEIESLFHGAYELEVSSPGADRPLRTAEDFQRFSGREVRLHVFRPLSIEELENKQYQDQNPKQKNFFGTLVGLQEGKVVLLISNHDRKGIYKATRKRKANLSALQQTNSEEGFQVKIPLPLISKANLEPQFDFEGSDERE